MAEQKRSGFKGHGAYGQYSDYMTNHRFVANQAKNASKNAGYPNQYYRQLLNKQSKNQARNNAETIETGAGHLTDLVSPKFNDVITNFVEQQSTLQWEIKQQMDKMDPNDPEYLNLKRRREAVKKSYQKDGNLFNQLKEYQQRGLDWTEDYANDNFSVVSDESDSFALSNIYGEKGNAEMVIDENGNISFGTPDMGYTALNDLPDYQNKAYGSSQTLLNNMTKAYSSGKVMDDSDLLVARNDFYEIMRKEGVDGTMSLAFDNLLDPNNSLLNIDDYDKVIEAIKGDDAALAIEAERILTDDLMEAYTDKLKSQHQKGFDNVNKAKNAKDNNKFNKYAYIQGEIQNIAAAPELSDLVVGNQSSLVWEQNLGPGKGSYRVRWDADESRFTVEKSQNTSQGVLQWVEQDNLPIPKGTLSGDSRRELAQWLNGEIGWITTVPESKFDFVLPEELDIPGDEIASTNDDGSIDYVPETIKDKKKNIPPSVHGLGVLAGPK